MRLLSLAEYDLLVEVARFAALVSLDLSHGEERAAELVEGLGDGLVLRGTVLLSRSYLVLRSGALALHKQLSQVLGLAVGGSPYPFLWLEGILGLGSLFSGWLLGRGLFFALSCWLGLFLFSRRLLNLEGFILYIMLIDIFLLAVELQPDDSLHVANKPFDHEQLVHESQLHLVLDGGQSSRVAQTLNKYEALRGLPMEGN